MSMTVTFVTMNNQTQNLSTEATTANEKKMNISRTDRHVRNLSWADVIT